jgi:hypothetical protein
MNSQEEIEATYEFYKNGKNCFEKAIGWQSTFAKEVIGKRKQRKFLIQKIKFTIKNLTFG